MIKSTCSNKLKNIRATLFFRASANCSKILNLKSISHTAKHFGATLFFRASANCSKSLNDKKYFNAVENSRATPFFRESANCSKVLNNNINIYIWYCEFRAHCVFQGKRMQVAQNSWM